MGLNMFWVWVFSDLRLLLPFSSFCFLQTKTGKYEVWQVTCWLVSLSWTPDGLYWTQFMEEDLQKYIHSFSHHKQTDSWFDWKRANTILSWQPWFFLFICHMAQTTYCYLPVLRAVQNCFEKSFFATWGKRKDEKEVPVFLHFMMWNKL